jgi:phage regulator Rha-like protein
MQQMNATQFCSHHHSLLAGQELTMSSQDIADLVESRHDNVKRTIERLAERGVIRLPPLGVVKNHLGQSVSVYEVCKRDS